MKATRIHRTGGPEVLTYEECQAPEPGAWRGCRRPGGDRGQLHGRHLPYGRYGAGQLPGDSWA